MSSLLFLETVHNYETSRRVGENEDLGGETLVARTIDSSFEDRYV